MKVFSMNKFFLIAILFCSCGVKQITTRTNQNMPKNIEELKQNTLDRNNYFNYQWLNINGKINITTPNRKIDLNISIKSKKDSIIWISLRSTIGLEIARCKLTQDSIFVIDRLNKNYFKKPIDYIYKKYGIELNFQQIQQIILTEVKTPNNELFELKHEENNYNLISENRKYVITRSYSLKKASIMYDEILVNITLFDYDETTGAPHKQYVEISGVDDFIFVTKYSKIQFDKNQKFSFNIPKNYEEIP